LNDAEVCVHRIKYDTVHMDETVYDLDSVAGDTSFRSYNLDEYDPLTVYVRVASTSTYFNVYYLPYYAERPPSAAAMTAFPLSTKYPLDILNPYLTIMVISYGGPSTYTLEYGRIDERDYAVSYA
jgi:hypothetical protein